MLYFLRDGKICHGSLPCLVLSRDVPTRDKALQSGDPNFRPGPRIILTWLACTGGAGNISRKNLSPEAWALYSANLLRIRRSTADQLAQGVSALDAATHAVTLFEDCPLFNCGKGAVSRKGGTRRLNLGKAELIFW